jgi:hypothetical protein
MSRGQLAVRAALRQSLAEAYAKSEAAYVALRCSSAWQESTSLTRAAARAAELAEGKKAAAKREVEQAQQAVAMFCTAAAYVELNPDFGDNGAEVRKTRATLRELEDVMHHTREVAAEALDAWYEARKREQELMEKAKQIKTQCPLFAAHKAAEAEVKRAREALRKHRVLWPGARRLQQRPPPRPRALRVGAPYG